MSTRPNILMIQSDQHRADCLGANGHSVVETPNLDSLADEGLNFRRAYTPIPQCTPSRVSLLTGTWPSRHRQISLPDTEPMSPPRFDTPTHSEVLSEAGYDLSYVGKWHIPQGLPLDYGFDEYVPNDRYLDWRTEQGLPERPRTTSSWFPDEGPDFGVTDEGIEPEESRIAWGAGRTIDLLESAADGNEPFFIRWDPFEPHLPNVVPEPFASMYDPTDLSPWGSFDDELDDKPHAHGQLRANWGVKGWSWDDWAPVVARYLGEITHLDREIGRVLDALRRLQLAEDTLVVYTSDHGDSCGGHGLVDKNYAMYEEITRVPLVLRWPDRIADGQESDAFVSHALDLAATFCVLGTGSAPARYQGRSLEPCFDGVPDDWRESIYATHYGGPFGLHSQRMVRTDRWKYVWHPTAMDELYDLRADSDELDNRAYGGGCQEVLTKMRNRLVEWLSDTDDPLTRPAERWKRTKRMMGVPE